MPIHSISNPPHASSSKSVETTNGFKGLTTAEKVAKFSAKCFVLIVALVAGSALGSTMQLGVPFLGAAIIGGLSFTIAMGFLEKIDAFFAARVAQRNQLPNDSLEALLGNE